MKTCTIVPCHLFKHARSLQALPNQAGSCCFLSQALSQCLLAGGPRRGRLDVSQNLAKPNLSSGKQEQGSWTIDVLVLVETRSGDILGGNIKKPLERSFNFDVSRNSCPKETLKDYPLVFQVYLAHPTLFFPCIGQFPLFRRSPASPPPPPFFSFPGGCQHRQITTALPPPPPRPLSRWLGTPRGKTLALSLSLSKHTWSEP